MYFRAAIQRDFPELEIRSFERVIGGWASDTFEVNGNFIFRFPRMPCHKFDLRKEIKLLPTLSGHMPVKVPEFEFINNEVPYVGYRKIEGVPITRCDLSDESLAKQMGRVLALLHAFPIEKALELGVLDIDWRKDYSDFYAKVRRETFCLLGENVRGNVSAFFESFLGGDNFSFGPRFIHRDLSGDAHILCDTGANRVVGIIDWEDACIGDPAIDFTGILWDCGMDFTERVLGHYMEQGGRLDPAFRNRTRFYREIGSLHAILYGQEIESQEQIKRGVEAVTAEFSKCPS